MNQVKNFFKDSRGFITVKTILWVVAILVVLGLLGISVEEDIVENEGVQENTSYVWSGVSEVWNDYLAEPLGYLWNDIFVGLLWESFIVNMQALRNGEMPVNFELQGDLPYPTLGEFLDTQEQNIENNN